MGKVPHLLLFSKMYGLEKFWTHTAAQGSVHISEKEEAYDPTGQTCYMEACERLNVVPASFFLQQMQSSELSMMHHGLGPQVF